MDIIREDYVPEVSGEEGVRVQISDQDMVLLPVENGFSVSPGVVAGVALKKASWCLVYKKTIFVRHVTWRIVD